MTCISEGPVTFSHPTLCACGGKELVMELKEMWSPFHSYMFTLLGDSNGCLITLFKLYFNVPVLPMQLIMILEMKML